MAEEDFNAAVHYVKTWKPSKTVPNDDKLKVYALFKQATIGDVNIARPGGFLNFEANAKWDAWNKLVGTSKSSAMEQYAAEVNRQKAEFS